MKGNEKISMLTSYDYSTARTVDEISKRYKLIESSRRIIPNVYDFKP